MIRTVITRKTIASTQSQVVPRNCAIREDRVPHPVPPQQDPGDGRVDRIHQPAHGSELLSRRRGGGGSAGRYVVDPARVERVAPQQPPDRQPNATQRSVDRDRGQCVLAAGRIEPATRRQGRTYPPTVRDDGSSDHAAERRRGHQHRRWSAGHRRRRSCGACGTAESGTRRPPLRRTVRARVRRARTRGSRARPTAAQRRVQVGAEFGVRRVGRGREHPDHDVGAGGRRLSRSRSRWRSRRRTLLRVTAGPTARGTTKPARGAVSVGGARRCTTRPSRAARRPRRMTTAKSSARRRRWSAASTVSPASRLRPKAVAPLGASRRENGATGTGAHAQPEAVGLRAPTVVRLVGALAHCRCLP